MKKNLVIIGIVLSITIVIGVSYGYWVINRTQNDQNIVKSSCFDVGFSGEGAFNLLKAYPLLDEEGLKLSPYKFTVSNNCNEDVGYYGIYLALDDTNTLNKNFVKVSIDNKIYKLSSLEEFDGFTGYSKMYLIRNEKLEFLGENEHELRIWIDEDVTVEDDAMNKTFNSKIVVKATPNKPQSGVENLLNAASTRDDMMIDDYGNLRFIGSDANNYIEFNGEEWRVIGVMKDMEVINEDGSTTEEDLIKIVRNETLGNIQWDSKNENDWTNAQLMTLLNGDYLNNEGTYTETSTIKSLVNEVDKIANVKWNIGGHNSNAAIAKDFYLQERGTIGGGKNPGVTTWNGKVALIYPSDYAYSVKGYAIDSWKCLNRETSYWASNGCAQQTWVHDDTNKFLLAPQAQDTSHVLILADTGSVKNAIARNVYSNIHPTVYLKSDIRLTGTGEQGANAFRIVN